MTVENKPPPMPRPVYPGVFGVKITYEPYDRSRMDVWWWAGTECGGFPWTDDRAFALRMPEPVARELLQRAADASGMRPSDGRIGYYNIEPLDVRPDAA